MESKKIEQLSSQELIRLVERLINSLGQPCQEIVEDFLSTSQSKKGKKPGASKEPFEISRYRQRHVAMQIQYEGAPYFGLASQIGDCDDTVEKHLFDALLKLRLIESRQTCNYSRCGRTDKGVSALGQVVAFSLRSAVPTDAPSVPAHPSDSISYLVQQKASTGDEEIHSDENKQSTAVLKEVAEMDYCGMINGSLPEDIRVIGWTEVTPDFSSRFSAASRTYRYFFLRKRRNIEAMRQAAGYLVGEHDFRNLCKMDLGNVSNFRREIFSANILPFLDNFMDANKEARDSASECNDVWMLEITGIAFLWHMIRCIMAILLMVGDGLEEPVVMQHLLDVENCPRKPQYVMADELPLVLHSCRFENLSFQWQPSVLWNLSHHYQQIFERHCVAAARAKNCLDFILSRPVRSADVNIFEMQVLEKELKRREKLSAKTNGKGNASSLVISSLESYLQEAKQRRGIGPIEEPEAEGAALKRPRIESDPFSKENEEKRENYVDEDCAWNDVLQRWKAYYPDDILRVLMPRDLKVHHHIPLTERPSGQLYEDRIKDLSGVRKERYERHVSLQATSSDRNKEFFANMRMQGSKKQ